MSWRMFTALSGADACMGWLAGLVLLVVGFIVVRKHHSSAGLLIGAAGVAKVLLNCCAVGPMVYQEALERPGDPTVLQLNGIVVSLLRLAVFAAVAGGLAQLARTLKSIGAKP